MQIKAQITHDEDILVEVPLGDEVAGDVENQVSSPQTNGDVDPSTDGRLRFGVLPTFTALVQYLVVAEASKSNKTGGKQNGAPVQAKEDDAKEDDECIENDEESQGQPVFPDCFYCPITKQVMTNPVVRPDGKSCEKSALTSARLLSACYENRALKAYIDQEMKHLDEAGSWKDTIRAWNESIRCSVQQMVAPHKYRPLPDSFYCPITCELIFDPVIDPEGISFERGAILKWIKDNGKSPITRTDLRADQLYDNNALLNALMEEVVEGEEEQGNIHPSIRRWKGEFAARQARALASAYVAGSTITNTQYSHAALPRPQRVQSPSTNASDEGNCIPAFLLLLMVLAIFLQVFSAAFAN